MALCAGVGRGVRRPSHGTRATSDEPCGTVLSDRAGDTGTAVAAAVATSGLTALLVARTAIVAGTAVVATLLPPKKATGTTAITSTAIVTSTARG